MAAPTYNVAIGWSSAQAGLLVFGYSTFQTISGVVQTTDVFGNAYSTFFNGAYDDVTNDVVSIRIRRGRDDILSQINAGTCELEVMLLNSANAPGFVPMRPVRVQATYGGTTYGLYWGFIRSARFDYATGICRISCVDLMLFMNRTNPLDPALSTTQGGDQYTPDDGTAADVESATVATASRAGLVRLA